MLRLINSGAQILYFLGTINSEKICRGSTAMYGEINRHIGFFKGVVLKKMDYKGARQVS